MTTRDGVDALRRMAKEYRAVAKLPETDETIQTLDRLCWQYRQTMTDVLANLYRAEHITEKELTVARDLIVWNIIDDRETMTAYAKRTGRAQPSVSWLYNAALDKADGLWMDGRKHRVKE